MKEAKKVLKVSGDENEWKGNVWERRKFVPFTADLMMTTFLHQCVIKQLLHELYPIAIIIIIIIIIIFFKFFM